MTHGQNMGFFGNLYVRHIAFDSAGDTLPGHSHQFGHTTLLSHGALSVSVLPKLTQHYTAPAFIPMPAEVVHTFTATEDGTEVWCIFAVRDLAGHVLDADEVDPEMAIGY